MAASTKKGKPGLRDFRSPDGIAWRVAVRAPGSSNAMVVFHYPDGRTSRHDRYAWHITHGPEARDVIARLRPEEVLDALTDQDLLLLYRRSMPIFTDVPMPEAG